MPGEPGTAVVDAGSTNWKVFLFSRSGDLVASETAPSTRLGGAPYLSIDTADFARFAGRALTALSQSCPIDTIVPCAHGSALALLDATGGLALPVMMYEADPPAAIKIAYERLQPDFCEVVSPTNPAALTLARQLLWQETGYADAFADVRTILPWGQYVACLLGASPVTEVTALGAQTHLWDVRRNRFSSLARRRGWDRLFAPLVPAWQPVGAIGDDMRARGFRGTGRILAGIHDSNANYLRCLAAGLGAFTLLSTGTWIIGFDSAAALDDLTPERDLVSNTDVFGNPVACCRFMGGREFELVSGGADPALATEAAAATLVADGILALPSFTESGGPAPGTGGRGRIEASRALGPPDQASLASLYTALMTDLSLDAVGSQNAIVVDGPFARAPVYLSVLAALRPSQRVLVSDDTEGTAAGAALLAGFDGDRPPDSRMVLRPVAPADIAGLSDYRRVWRDRGLGMS